MLDAWLWARKPKDPPDVKEGLGWVEGYEIVADLAETVPDTRLVYVADREGDLRALIDAAARRGTPADGLIRSKHNRKTSTGGKLWERLAQSDPLGCDVVSDSDGVNRSDRHPESLHYPPAFEAAVCDKARGARISIDAREFFPAEAGYMFETFLHFKLNSSLDSAGWTIHG